MPRKAKVAAAETTETTAIVLRIAADHAKDFEAMFEAEEIPIWDDFARRGRLLEARLVRAIGGSEQGAASRITTATSLPPSTRPTRSMTQTLGTVPAVRRRHGSR